MKLGLGLDLWADAGVRVPVESVQHAEALGYDSVWTAEAYGSDAITPLAFLAAHTTRIRLATGIAQISARTPTATAMAFATLDALCGGRGDRVICGLGLSGPQVVEGWYGAPWARPHTRLRDTVEIMRGALRREGPLVHDGAALSVPYSGPGATGMGKPLKSILHSNDLPIWIAAGGERNVELAAERCDGWIPMGFRPGMVESHYGRHLGAGWDRRGGRPDDFEIAPSLTVHITDDLRATFDRMKPRTAMYVGGMGHPEMNFHNQSMARVGFPEAAARIQELFLAGRRDEATAAVPDEFLDSGGLFGSVGRIRERYAAWESSGATTLVVRSTQAEAVELVADLAGTRDR